MIQRLLFPIQLNSRHDTLNFSYYPSGAIGSDMY
jgi:hypothetical protein